MQKKYKPHLKKWKDLGLNTMAISIVNYSKDKNKKVYTPDSEYINLEKVIKNLHDIGYSIRLCCMMFKNSIDSVEEVKKLAEFAKKNNVEQLTIRSIKASENSENKKIREWTKKHALPKSTIKKIGDYLKNNAKKLMTLGHGAIVYDLNGQNIANSDCLTIKADTDELRQLIFFPDGHLRYDWQYPGAILM
jgi:wyosine [tRNA(Phe)-imidazoG37] synthetase (radical SAM superfamily)